MKKMLLFLFLGLSWSASFGQHAIFMEILENKKICNKEDELTYFLQAKSYDRQNEDHYYHHYARGGEFYTTCIINRNECYIIYHTDDAADYNKIKASITSTCTKELAADKSVSYICNDRRMQDVQVIFSGFLQAEKVYEIMVYQNPHDHETPYNQADRLVPQEKQVVKKAKAKRRVSRTTTTTTTTTSTTKTEASPAKVNSEKPVAKTAAPAI